MLSRDHEFASARTTRRTGPQGRRYPGLDVPARPQALDTVIVEEVRGPDLQAFTA